MKDDRFIDIEKTIRSKNPRLLRWMPRFLIRYLKKVIHQDESNKVIAENEGNNSYEFSRYVLDYLDIEVIVKGIENIPKEGGAIVAVNHPLGGMDAISIIHEIHPIRNDMKFVVNDLLLQLDNMKDSFVGVNKHGKNTKESLLELNKLFESDRLIFVFPAGMVSRRKKKKVEDLEWKKTFITRSRKYKKPVIPVYLDGELSDFFYRLANFRTRIGVKANIEMFYLVDELFKQRGKTVNIIIGEPIPADTFDLSKKRDIEWAQWVKSKAYSLKDKLDDE